MEAFCYLHCISKIRNILSEWCWKTILFICTLERGQERKIIFLPHWLLFIAPLINPDLTLKSFTWHTRSWIMRPNLILKISWYHIILITLFLGFVWFICGVAFLGCRAFRFQTLWNELLVWISETHTFCILKANVFIP